MENQKDIEELREEMSRQKEDIEKRVMKIME